MTDETLPEPAAYAVESVHDGEVYEIDLFKKQESADLHVRICGGVTTPLYTAATLRQAVKRARREALEEAANAVPTSWMHPLLASNTPFTNPRVEQLLRGVKAAILELTEGESQ